MATLTYQFFDNQGIWTWNLDPGILTGLVAWTIGYIFLVGPLRRRQGWEPAVSWARQAAFHIGTFVLFIALVSPIDHLADTYLLSAHMVQHLLLLLVVPPLWLMGMPNAWLDTVLPQGSFVKIIRWVTRPMTAFLIFNGVFYAWHIPFLYDAALFDEKVHILEHLMFLACAILGWWPVLGFLPENAPRAAYPLQALYIFFMMVFSTGLGAIFSFAKDPFYPFYQNAPHILGNTPVSSLTEGSRLWNLSVMDDQETAGLIMWIPGNMIFFAAFMIDLFMWFRNEERKSQDETMLHAAEEKPVQESIT
jgi:putative membrane protein